MAISYFVGFATKFYAKMKDAFDKSLDVMSDILGNIMGSITEHVKFNIIPVVSFYIT